MAKKKSNKKNIKAAYMDKKVALVALTARTRGPARSAHRTVSVQGCPVLTVKNGAGMADSKAYVLAQAQSEHPKISVVMPVYNVADFVAESLDSVLSQSLTDLEIICVDDGSTDASLDIVRSYAKREDRITILAQQNAGSGRARNAGIAVARGEFIAFLDSDEFIIIMDDAERAGEQATIAALTAALDGCQKPYTTFTRFGIKTQQVITSPGRAFVQFL